MCSIKTLPLTLRVSRLKRFRENVTEARNIQLKRFNDSNTQPIHECPPNR
jgi:hypothetical protein